MKQSFHFDLGNSSTGPMGLSARIEATSKEEALQLLRDAIANSVDEWGSVHVGQYEQGVDYIHVYLNPDAITVRAIDSVDQLQEEEA